MTHEDFMREALLLAQAAADEGEVPVGAVVVKNGAIVGRGRNRRETAKQAAALEPCPMCAGAIINARIRCVFFGASDKKAGSCGSLVDLFSLPYNHKPRCVAGILEEECAKALRVFFRELREKPRG